MAVNANHPGADIELAAGVPHSVVLLFRDGAGDPIAAPSTITAGIKDGEDLAEQWVTVDSSAAASGQITLTWDVPASITRVTRKWWLASAGDVLLAAKLKINELGDRTGQQPAPMTVQVVGGVVVQAGVAVTSLTTADLAAKADQSALAAETAARVAGDAAKVSKSGDTMTGPLVVGATSTYGFQVHRTNGTADSRRLAFAVALDGTVLCRILKDGGTLQREIFTAHPDGRFESYGEIAAPAATTAGRAVTVTAHDAATGRIQIAGQEIGGTGVRDIAGLLASGWTADSVNVARSGPVTTIEVANLAGPGSGSSEFLVLPQVFRPVMQVADAVGGTPWSLSTAGSFYISPAISGATFATSYLSSGWSASLPGTQVTPPASL